jgi:hypothetical protein
MVLIFRTNKKHKFQSNQKKSQFKKKYFDLGQLMMH